MVITRSILLQNNGNIPLPFFGGNYPIIILDNIYLILLLNRSPYPDGVHIVGWWYYTPCTYAKETPDYLPI